MEPKIVSSYPADYRFAVSESGKLPGGQAAEAPLSAPGDRVSLSPSAGGGKREKKMVRISVLPQDPQVSPAETIEFPEEKIGKKVSGERVAVYEDKLPVAIADPDGNYFFSVGTPQFDQVNAHTVAYRTLDMYEELMGHGIEWAFDSPRLLVLPHKQEGKNAYYARWQESVNFFYFNSRPLDKTVQTSESADVVSHETGHAVLDGLRPNYLGGFNGSETGAFHEAFGDITAMLLAMRSPANLQAILDENGGDFRNESLLSRLAEEFGKAVHLEDSDPANDGKKYLRTAINNFTYADPSTLPDGKDDDKLTSEVHNFSRLFTATFYDCLEGVYKQNLAENRDSLSALKAAGEDMGKIFGKAVDLAPTSRANYRDIALSMLKADELSGGRYQSVLRNVFVARKILSRTDLQRSPLPDFKLDRPPSSAEEALKLIRNYGDALELPPNTKVERLTANEKGETFISCSYSRQVPVSGRGLEKYGDCVTNLAGGLTLAFDAQGRLLSLAGDPVDEEKIENAMREIAGYDEAGLILRSSSRANAERLVNSRGELYRAVLVPTFSGQKVLQKLPVID